MKQNFKFKNGLAVMRAQPPHIGHLKLIKRMLSECEAVTLILGSVQEQGTERNPFSYIQRKQMIQEIFKGTPEGDRIKIIGLFDINNPTEWAGFVLDFLKESMPERECPDVYYAGSFYDAHWFGQAFDTIQIEDRVDYNFPYVSGSMVRDMIKIGDKRWKDFVPEAIWPMIEDFSRQKKGVI